jgi:hypothetical protein
MNRRHFIKLAGALCGASAAPFSFNLNAAEQNFSGKFVVTVQISGGWDVTSICDPKMNVAGESEITQWSKSGEIQTAGNIRYAPFANNAQFFDKYYQDMLVINGVDAQTNAHNAGDTHFWSGRISAGYPTLTSLYSHANAPDLAVSYINNGGYSETAGIIRANRMDDASPLQTILNPNSNYGINNNLHTDNWAMIKSARENRLNRLLAKDGVTPLQQASRSNYQSALNNADVLQTYASNLESAGEFETSQEQGDFTSNLNLQAQLAIIAMYSGVSSAADLYISGFDSHTKNDSTHQDLLPMLFEGVDKLWSYAEQYGIADRLVVLIGSEFGRTPYYNDDNGKDHWPIGSSIIMEKNASWTNRVVGVTDDGHFAKKINPQTLQLDESAGRNIFPKDVMSSLRQYLQIDQHPSILKYPLKEDVNFDFFNGNLSTPQNSDSRNSIRV